MTCDFACLAAAIYISIQIKERMDKVKKGYEVEGLITAIMKMVIITAVILAFTYRLAQHKGIPSVLIWVLIVIMVYGYITSNTTVGRYFMQWEETRRQQSFPVSIQIRFISWHT